MKKTRQQYDLDYKLRIVAEYLSGTISAEGLARGERIETIVTSEGVSIEQARKIRGLEEELDATQKKLAQTVLENELLKKLQPTSPFARKSSGYIETKQLLVRARGRAK